MLPKDAGFVRGDRRVPGAVDDAITHQSCRRGGGRRAGKTRCDDRVISGEGPVDALIRHDHRRDVAKIRSESLYFRAADQFRALQESTGQDRKYDQHDGDLKQRESLVFVLLHFRSLRARRMTGPRNVTIPVTYGRAAP